MQYFALGIVCFLLGDAIGVNGIIGIGNKVMGLF